MAIKKLRSNDYIVFIDDVTAQSAGAGSVYRPVACITTAGISGSRNTIEINDRCDDESVDAIPGKSTNTITGSGNAIDESAEPSMDSAQTLLELYQSGKEFWMKIANKSGSTAPVVIREGFGFFTDYSETADTDTPYTFDFTFRSKGKFNTVETT